MGTSVARCRVGRLPMCAAMIVFATLQAHAMDISSRYSPWDRSRPARPATRYIVLHTTEGPTKGSLNDVYEHGEAHFLVDTAGHIYRIIHLNKIAAHAGRSMWRGMRNLDSSSIGIEVVGYHNRNITTAQYKALSELLKDLRKTYHIADTDVLCHSMVAYGTPNKWHPSPHRGRKRCGMLFASTIVRHKLGLYAKPAYDPDVAAGRLVVGDPVLHAALYGKQKPAVAERSSTTGAGITSAVNTRSKTGETAAVQPSGAGPAAVQDTGADSPDGFRVIGRDGNTAKDIAGTDWNKATTMYFFPDGLVRRGTQLAEEASDQIPKGTRMLVGYTYGGYVTRKKQAYDICGKRWNYPSTLYRFPDGTIKTGDQLRENLIPENSMVFFRD